MSPRIIFLCDELDAESLISLPLEFRRIREGIVFTLFVRPHLVGGNPSPSLGGGTPVLAGGGGGTLSRPEGGSTPILVECTPEQAYSPGQDRGTPPTPGLEYCTILTRTGVPPSQDWGTPLADTGVIPPPPTRTGIPPGQVTLRAVCLVQFPTGGISCFN